MYLFQSIPISPSNLKAIAVSFSQINLSWQDNSSDEDGFKIERKIGINGTYSEIATVGANVTSYSNTGLNANTTYYYRVRAYNSYGNSEYSNETSATTPSCPSPDNPSNPSPANGATGISINTNLDWSDCADATSYDVYFGTTSSPPKVGTVTSSTYDPGILLYNKTYYWKILAKNACGETAGPIWYFTTQTKISVHLWAKTYKGSLDDYARSIQQTNDGGYIVAGYTKSWGAGNEDFWVIKLNAAGDIEWQRCYGGSNEDRAYSIQQTSDGGYIVTGITRSFDANFWNIWVLKLTSNGDIEWQRIYGGYYNDGAYSIQQTSDGGYIVAGHYNSWRPLWGGVIWILKLTSNGDVEWQRTYEAGREGFIDYVNVAYSIQQTTDGGYILAGYMESFAQWGAGWDDFEILKLASNGDVEWHRTYGGHYGDRAYSIQQTNDGGYIVAGYSRSWGAGGEDILVIKMNAAGDIEWQRCYGESNNDRAYSIQQTSDGGYIVAGYTWSWGAGWNNFLVLKLNSEGDIEWQRYYGGSNDDCAYSIQQTSDGGYICAGYAESFDTGNSDIWIIKLSSAGDIDPSCGFIESFDATVADTAIVPQDTNITPQDRNITPRNSNITLQDTDAVVNLLCETPKYSLAISTTTGGTTDPEPDLYTYYSGIEVLIEAIPETDYRFSGWTGDVPQAHETDNPITITMDSDKSIKANFIRQYTLTISAKTGGTTDPAPGTYTYDSGTQVTITAKPNSGYRFSSWSGDASGPTNPITITMDSDKSVTANFTKISSDGDGKGNGGACFIATACYGTTMAEEVKTLCAFRDQYLLTNRTGQALIKFYYSYSPKVADFIRDKEQFRTIFRECLKPFIWVISKIVK